MESILAFFNIFKKKKYWVSKILERIGNWCNWSKNICLLLPRLVLSLTGFLYCSKQNLKSCDRKKIDFYRIT